MKLGKAAGLALLLALPTSSIVSAQSIPNNRIKIGILTDMNGMASDLSGRGSVVAAELAVEDFQSKIPGVKIEVVFGDHQLKADVASNIARQWIDREGVNAIVDLPSSSAALAVSALARDTKAVVLLSAGGTDELTGAKCSPNTVQWTYDTWATANSTVRAMSKVEGGTWFFITADYAFGHSLERQASKTIAQLNGKVLGSVRHPFNMLDPSSFLLQAQASNAKIIALANSAGDAINSVKMATEFGITKNQRLAALGMMLPDVQAVGLTVAQGLYVTEAFYWNMNAETRAWSDRFTARMRNGNRPNQIHAGVYGAIIHYLKAVNALNSTDGPLVVKKMKDLPTDDPLFGKGYIRADGRKIHNMYLFRARSPASAKEAWDNYELVATVSGEDAFRPLNEGGCPLVTQ